MKEEARSLLWPLQAGVASPLGAETIVHTLQQYVERNKDSASKVVLKIDFKNAFNCVLRDCLIKAATEKLPSISAWTIWTYGAPSELLRRPIA